MIERKIFTNRDWDIVKPIVRNKTGMTYISYMTWINPLVVRKCEEHKVFFEVPINNEMAIQYIKVHFSKNIIMAISQYLDDAVEVVFEIGK